MPGADTRICDRFRVESAEVLRGYVFARTWGKVSAGFCRYL